MDSSDDMSALEWAETYLALQAEELDPANQFREWTTVHSEPFLDLSKLVDSTPQVRMRRIKDGHGQWTETPEVYVDDEPTYYLHAVSGRLTASQWLVALRKLPKYSNVILLGDWDNQAERINGQCDTLGAVDWIEAFEMFPADEVIHDWLFPDVVGLVEERDQREWEEDEVRIEAWRSLPETVRSPYPPGFAPTPRPPSA